MSCLREKFQEDNKEKEYEKRHIFGREENVAISSGAEAAVRIPGLRSRLYIREMKLFVDVAREDLLYRNRQRLVSGNFILSPGDILLIKDIMIEVWEEQIAVRGLPGSYTTVLLEKSPEKEPFEGFPVYKRSPRLIKKVSSEKFLIELPKENEKQNKVGLFMTILPSLGMIFVTVFIGLLIGRGLYMIMSVAAMGMTVLFSGVRYFDEKKTLKRKKKIQKKRYLAYLRERQRKIAEACMKEQQIYDFWYPDIAEISRMIKEYDSRIYERLPSDEDFLTVSVGSYTGEPECRIVCKESGWEVQKDDLTKLAEEICRKYSSIVRPKSIDLKKVHLGMAGEKEILHRQLKMLLIQLAVFQSYHDLRMIVVFDKKYEKEFVWMRWLPHMRLPAMNVLGMVHSGRTRDVVLGSMSRILKERTVNSAEGKRKTGFTPHYLFIIDDPSLIIDHGIMEYLQMDGNELGFSIIYTSGLCSRLPEYIGTVLLLEHSREGTLLIEEKVYKNQKIKLYPGQGIDFEWLARNLSVLEHEKGITNHIPDHVTFLEMYGVERPEELEIRKRWKKSQSHKSLAVPVGMRLAGDVLFLNLHEKAHGPHGLVAGMTGSGKSELVQSYILSLAVNFHPHEVGFLLIDYKGGSMAGLFEGLPHHLGTITNLDGGGSRRALMSVKAELSRRQEIFRGLNVNHINGYMRLFKEELAAEPIPHLFIISDEFAELKKEQPDFMKELVSAARIGRSLGVHLILATQKPAGVVDEQIWSNSRFRLCLKVQDENDSREILKTPDAAGITLPGRAYLQVGNNEIYELFQSALSGTPYQETQEREAAGDERVYVVNELGQGELINQDLSGGIERYRALKTQLMAVAEHIREVFDAGGDVQVKRPWLPPLPKMLISPYVKEEETTELPQKGEGPELSVCIGRMDIPEMQMQKELVQEFIKDGNLLFMASGGFGKTTFLATILISLALLNDVEILNFYILDYGNNGCMPLKGLPHTAEYITVDDEERYVKFKKLIMKEIADRKKEIEVVFRKAIIVAIDQLEVVRETGIEEEEFFTRLTRDGSSLGIYTVATTMRINGIRQATLHNFKNRIAGYSFDENETFLAVGRTEHRQTDVKGRVLVSGESVHEAQLYAMAPCEDKILYSKALKELAEKIRRKYPGREAPHITVLPQEFPGCMLDQYENDGSSYLVGLDAEEVTGKGFDKNAGLFVIIGNTGTGKTNMLQILAIQAAARGRTYIFDSKSMEMYHYRRTKNVLYVESLRELAFFMNELGEEMEIRRQFLKEQLGSMQGLSPKKVIEKLPFCTILIDDIDDFTEFIKKDTEKAASLIKEGITLGITCIITVHAGKSRGMSELDRLVKQAANGLVLSSQGLLPVFPAAGRRELLKVGEGLLFKNSVSRKVRLPVYTCLKEADRKE